MKFGGLRGCFNNHEVVERQRIVRVSLRFPELHSGLFTFDPYQGLVLLKLMTIVRFRPIFNVMYLDILNYP
jgi:hypothetical protein